MLVMLRLLQRVHDDVRRPDLLCSQQGEGKE